MTERAEGGKGPLLAFVELDCTLFTSNKSKLL